MQYHSQFKEFGELELVETIEYYDKPVFVLCKNKEGNLFLAVEIDETKQEEIWLYVRLNDEMWRLIKSNIIDLHHAFRLSADSKVYEVYIPHDVNSLANYKILQAMGIPDSKLPERGEYLDRNQTKDMAPAWIKQSVNRLSYSSKNAGNYVSNLLGKPKHARLPVY